MVGLLACDLHQSEGALEIQYASTISKTRLGGSSEFSDSVSQLELLLVWMRYDGFGDATKCCNTAYPHSHYHGP